MVQRYARVATLIAAVSLAFTGTAAAQGTLDQSNDATAGGIGSSYFLYDPVLLAQTFTPAATGALDQVDVLVRRDPLAAKPFVVQIRDVADGQPGTTILASAPVQPAGVASMDHVWISVPLARSLSIAGTRYALVLSAPGAGLGGNYYWAQPSVTMGDPNPDHYPVGEGFRSSDGTTWDWHNASADFAFRTYVLSPPDTTITDGPPDGTTTTEATFTFSSPRATARFECRLDSPTWQPCTSPVSYGALAVGAHTFTVRAADDPLLVDPSPAERTWTIAAPPPAPAPPAAVPAVKPLVRTRVLAGARLRLVLAAGSGCVSGPTVAAQVTGTRLRSPFVRITRVRFMIAGRITDDRRAPFMQQLRLPASVRRGGATTLSAHVTLRLTRGRTTRATLRAPIRRCG